VRPPGPSAALLLAALLAAPAPAGAEPPDDAVTAREAELEGVRREIRGLSAQLDALAATAFGIQGEIDKVALQRRLQERRLAEARAAYALAEQRAAAASGRVTDLEARIADERARLEDRLAGLYRIGRHGHARLIFSIDPHADPLPAIRLLRYLAERDAASISRFETLRAALAAEREDLDQRRAEAADWLAQETQRRDELVRLEQRQKLLLAGNRREGARLAERALELADRETKVAALLDTLYGRAASPLAGRPMQEFRGLLDWPARGAVTGTFGPRLDPRYGTRVPHNGIDLATTAGGEVVAVYPGRVVFAASFEGYGPTVVVQHAGKVFTLYAGLAATLVKRDDLVSLRQPLGRAGETLYFEIRVENRPEDPRRWLR
jgi:septal ring factor EnvC (AmiA/AmiB activator)